MISVRNSLLSLQSNYTTGCYIKETIMKISAPRVLRRGMWTVTFLLLLLLAGLATELDAARIEVRRQLDLRQVLSNAPPDFVIRALAYDGTDLWLLSPYGHALLRVSAEDGSLLARHSLSGVSSVEPAGMAFGRGDLWLADATGVLLRLSRDGVVRSIDQLPSNAGPPMAVDFIATAAHGSDFVDVAHREVISRFEVGSGSPRLVGQRPLIVPGAAGRATVRIDGVEYTWVSAPRNDRPGLRGDGPPEGGYAPIDVVMPPDDSIPRGGEDPASTHRLGRDHHPGRRPGPRK